MEQFAGCLSDNGGMESSVSEGCGSVFFLQISDVPVLWNGLEKLSGVSDRGSGKVQKVFLCASPASGVQMDRRKEMPAAGII